MRVSSLLRIGWIGTGVMGVPICERLLQAGYHLTVFSRTRQKAQPLLDHGAHWSDSPKELVEHSDVVCTMVGFPQDVRALYLGSEGIFKYAHEGKLFVDLTTSEPALAQELARLAREKGAVILDAPVSGGEIGAKKGTLAMMVGGDVGVFERLTPFFTVFTQSLVHHGDSGAGQHAKMCNQITIAGTMIGVCEALVYARQAGLDAEKLLCSIRVGAAGCWTLDHLAPRMLKRDFSAGFFVEHFIKDMGMALDEAKRMGVLLPGLALVRKLYLSTKELGHGRSGTQALLLALEKHSPTFPVSAQRPGSSCPPRR